MISFKSRPLWHSKKPVGILHVCDEARTGSSGSNPKGWFFNAAADIVGDPENMRVAMNTYCDQAVDVLSQIHAQGALFWQLEGNGDDVPFYMGDPTQIFDLSPEWLTGMFNARTLGGSIIREMMERFTSEGFKVGGTIRPHNFNMLTLAWELSSNPTHNLWRKARWAYDHLGWRMFYIDSNFVDLSGVDLLPAIAFDKLHKLMPDCLFVPEHEEGGYYNSTVPYGDFSDSYQPTKAYVREFYPNAMRFVNVGAASDAQLDALLNNPTGRDIMAVDAWWFNPTVNKIITGLAGGWSDGG